MPAHNDPLVWRSRECADCETQFAPATYHQSYCSARCRKRNERRRGGHYVVGHVIVTDCGWCSRGFVREIKGGGFQRAGRNYCSAPCEREASRFGVYGLNHLEAQALKELAGCSACGAPFKAGRGWTRDHVDHDHRTGIVRGRLCGRCNIVLGYLRDDPAYARQLIAYLEEPANDPKLEGKKLRSETRCSPLAFPGAFE